jgi:hypothetical protein
MAIKKTASKGAPIEMPPPDDGLSPETLGGVRMKPHYFELSMRSVSNGVLNQEVPLVREYADTPGELALKQMAFTELVETAGIVKIVIAACKVMSKPYLDLGEAEMAAKLAAFGDGQ